MGLAPHAAGSRTLAYDIDANRVVRTIPSKYIYSVPPPHTWLLQRPLYDLESNYYCVYFLHLAWAHSINEDDEDIELAARSPLPAPLSAELAQHNSRPSPKNKQKAEPGRLYDQHRDWIPYTQRTPLSEHASRWRVYIRSTVYSDTVREPTGERVTQEWLVRHGPDYSQPWLAGSENQDAENDAARLFKHHTHKKAWWQRMQRIILRNAMIPLVIRATVLAFSAAAMSIAATLWSFSASASSSVMMATIVDAVALVYLIGITYDEYNGKPLGLRSATAKMRLIFLDLFFIVFDSANLSLAFQAVSNSDLGCHDCDMLEALAAVLLIALVSWLMTFAISVLRYVHLIPLVSEKAIDVQN